MNAFNALTDAEQKGKIDKAVDAPFFFSEQKGKIDKAVDAPFFFSVMVEFNSKEDTMSCKGLCAS